MSMKIRIKPKKGISYGERKKANKEIREEFAGEEESNMESAEEAKERRYREKWGKLVKKKEPKKEEPKKESSIWDGIKKAVLGKSFEETMKDNQKKNKAKLRKKK